MPISRQQLVDAANLVDLYAAQSERLIASTSAAVAGLYVAQDLYSPAVVAGIAAQAADQSNTANLLAAGMAAQYLALVSVSLDSPVTVPNIPLPPIRNGVELAKVYERPVKKYRRLIAKGIPSDQALEQATKYAAAITDGNIRLAKRDMARAVMYRETGIVGYRRVIRPELSETGTCGLCLAASDQLYKRGDLMPIHDRCKCEPMPIIGSLDPGNSLNNLTIGQLYQAASDKPNARRESGTHAFDLKRTRWKVNEHGEWGPVLTVKGQRFTGPDELAAAA